MLNNIISDNKIEELIQKVMFQTNYNKEQAKEKLILFNFDYIKVIKDYIGIVNKKETIKSVNQEIFRQIRKNLDNSMKTYREKNPIDMLQVIKNLNESDEREKHKNEYSYQTN